jgi:hypothetical protein
MRLFSRILCQSSSTTPGVIPEVRRDPSPSHNDIRFMVNSALERQAKSTDELLCMLIE